MTKQHSILKTLIIFILILLQPFIQPTLSSTSYEDELLDGGWLIKDGNCTILYVSGSHYQMGYQHGYLLKEKTQQNIRAYLANAPTDHEKLLSIWRTMEPYIPPKYVEEIQGIADGSNLSYEDICTAYTVIIYGDMGCFGLSCWGNATKDGELLHARSFDLPMDVQDPVSGRFVHENHMLVVREPDDSIASISPSVAGSMHGGGGFNMKQISVGMQVCWSNDQTFHGIPGMIRTQMVLDNAHTATEAINILTSNRTLGWNYIVSDAKTPEGYAVETTANHTYIGSDTHPVEDISAFWSIEDMVRRTNFFIEPTIVSTQREDYNPSTLKMFFKLLKREDFFFAIWQSYNAVSKAFEKQYGSYTLPSLMTMFRESYKGNTNFLLKFIISKAEDTSFNHAWNMWIVQPSSGAFMVCFAGHDTIAYDEPAYSYNIADFL
ncbi:MAG: hypothetical protein KGY65_02340 [Candidatus Thermoplasmatota archaeon]|nr:hypothetical protein [Candidatus Thermoplasmatota archaeon]MBS3801570.1 hypothetical protein [Candidatus Thermoplasmatota archaeon]